MAAELLPGDVDAALVERLAAWVGLALSAEQLPEVVANLQRTLDLAQAMISVPLEPTQEAAPIWRP